MSGPSFKTPSSTFKTSTRSNGSLSLGTYASSASTRSAEEDSRQCSLAFDTILSDRGQALRLINNLGIPAALSPHIHLMAYGAYGMIFKTDDVQGVVSTYSEIAVSHLVSAPDGEWKRAIKAGHFTTPPDHRMGQKSPGVVKIQVITSLERLHEVVEEDRTHQTLDSRKSWLRGMVPRFHAGLTVYTPWPPGVNLKELSACQRALPGLVFRVTIMDLIEGHVTLSQYVKDFTPNQESRKGIYRSLREVLLHMWASGLVHCDLHAGNILVQPVTLQVKLIDFGFAKQLRHPDTIKACKAVLDQITSGHSKNHESAVKSYGDCTDRVKAEMESVFKAKDLPWFHLDMNMLRSVRQWVKDPKFKLGGAQGFHPLHDGDIPNWVNKDAIRARNQVQNSNIFYNKIKIPAARQSPGEKRSPVHTLKTKVVRLFAK